jgi:peptidyl-dipeptidase Dcp
MNTGPSSGLPPAAFVLTFALLMTAPHSAATSSEATPAENPLLAEHWDTPFGTPPFDLIRDEHFLPAFEQAMAEKRAEVAAISARTDTPTFENTIAALDRTGVLLEQVESVFSNLNSADTNDTRQSIARTLAPQRAALNDDILLDPALFARVKAVWDARDQEGLSHDQLRLLRETYRMFVRGGAALTPEQKERFREINRELASLSVTFGDNVLKATNSYRLVVDDPAELAGLPPRVVQGAAESAKAAGHEGKWVFTLHWPSLWPFMEAADSRALREKLLAAYAGRTGAGTEADNRPVLTRMASLRAERARLLGYASHADYVLEDRMAETPARAKALLDQVWPAARTVAAREAADMQAMIDAASGGFRLGAADWRYYAEKIRRERYALDEDTVRAYFPLERVRAGAFEVARRLYGITVTERPDLPTYHPDVKAFEVKEADGRHVGVFYTDYFPRPGKRSGAWSSSYRSQRFADDGTFITPVVVNVGNFSRPSGGDPALLSLDEVKTLFHEFGHGLHALFQRVAYRGIRRTSTDFVELPSQIMENWAFEPEVLALYARHFRTGELIPDELVGAIRRARTFNQGFATVEYAAAAYLDLAWHTWTAPREVDADAFEQETLERLGMPAEILPRYRSTYFQHIFSGGYSAGYYSYLWSAVLDADAFEAFREKGLFDPATAAAFRKEVLERGGSDEAMVMFLRFRGREPSVEPLLVRRGLKDVVIGEKTPAAAPN